MRTSEAPTSSTTRRNRSKSSMPAWRVRVMPVSGAQHASVHEMLQAAVHSMYMREGNAPASSARRGGAASFFSGTLSGQSPQNFDPPALRSARSSEATRPLQTSWTVVCRTSPSTRLPYGSAHPQTIRPSQSITSVLHGQLHWNRVARKLSDMDVSELFLRELLHVRLELVVLVLDRIEKEALGEIAAAFGLVHLIDEVMDFLDHVLEGALELLAHGDLLIQRLHDRQQVAVEHNRSTVQGLDGTHRLSPEAFDGGRLVSVYLDEILRAGHRQHGLDAFLHAGELEVTAGIVHLAVEIHQAADGCAVDVGDGRHVDENVLLAGTNQAADRGRKVGQDRVHQPRLADPDDRDAAVLLGFHIHQLAPVLFSAGALGKSSARSLRIWRASSVRPRLIRDLTVPSGSRSLSAISW